MKSKKQIEIGKIYWWQQIEAQFPTQVEVLKFNSNVLVQVKNAEPHVYKKTSHRELDNGMFEVYVETTILRKNLCFGDIYDHVHIKHLTSEKPRTLMSNIPTIKSAKSIKTNFDS